MVLKLKINWKLLIICIAIPLAVGALSAFLTNESMEQFQELRQPPLSPPSWVFPIVWTLLFIMMGTASYIIIMSGLRGGTQESRRQARSALCIYILQLAVNFFWPLLFFNMKIYLAAFMWLLLLWILIVTMMFMFYRISKIAGYLIVPYVLWVTFAGYLNLGIYFLN
ncbi:MAG: tryptophan-rich sensory protein [Firmicutes bacterium]|nr:tryptophan-rich sensory protein [Bacillota bacterium]